ncbi:MAG: ATP-binding protein [Bacteroidota bacterium]
MHLSKYRALFSWSVLCLFILFAVFYVQHYFQPERLWEEELTQFTHDLTKGTDGIATNLDATPWTDIAKDDSLKQLLINRWSGRFEEYGDAYFLYEEDSLVFWSTNRVPIDSLREASEGLIVQLSNGYYHVQQQAVNDSLKVFGILLIKNEFPFNNAFIVDGFSSCFSMDNRVEVILDREQGYPVYNAEEEYLLSLDPNNIGVAKYALVLSLLIVLIICIFCGVLYSLLRLLSPPVSSWALLFFVFLIGLVRWWMITNSIPSVFYQLELFQPHLFAASRWLPNLGDLLLHVIFLAISVFLVVRFFHFQQEGIREKWAVGAVGFLGITVIIAFFVFVIHVFYNLVSHSSISFEVHKFFGLSFYSFLSYFLFFVLLVLQVFLIDKFWRLLSGYTQYFYAFLFVAIYSALLFFLLFLIGVSYSFHVYLFYFSLLVVTYLYRKHKRSYSHSGFLAIVFICTLFIVWQVSHLSHQKELEKRKVVAVNLSNERDQIAEMFLAEMEQEIVADTVINGLMQDYLDNELLLQDYIQRTYFYGYLRKYDLQVSVCSPYDELTLIHENSTEVVHCYSFFDELVEEQGVQLPNSRFVFVDNLNGQISYLGEFVYSVPIREGMMNVSLYVSLDSRLISEELGYPELLLDERMSRHSVLSGYSYAKYRESELITRSGAINYQLIFPEKWDKQSEFTEIIEKGISHLIYRQDEMSRIVISRQVMGFMDYVAAFSYVFVFIYLAGNMLLFIIGFPSNFRHFRYDFKNRIKLSFVALLVLSLIIVGAGTIFYNIKQYQERTYQQIGEKLQSVLVEMEQKLGGEPSLTADYAEYLRYLLSKFSNVFYVDINLYDAHGDLLASSREQVFEAGLLFRKMNPEAFSALEVEQQGRYIHQERIEGMEYYSAYLPFKNDANELLAYINLPYFTKQREMKEEVYTIIVAVVNIYFFLILLSTIVAVVITNRITRPIQLLQERLKDIRLGRHNEPLNYSSEDEIGELVNAYNRMVIELEQKANELAKTERETAWREMAKQIAHEIKNPLTPMKLSVQHLKRAWDDGVTDFDSRMHRFSTSMIGQINNLNSIASAFSNFARMPKARNSRVNIVEQLNNAVALYGGTQQVKITPRFNIEEEVFVYADKEQLLIVFSNLLKNAIQSIPPKQDGYIDVSLKHEHNRVVVSFSDNGSGISDEVQEKLFQPNFTTKGSGMGLGLAIVKNIVENAGGTVTYKTAVDKGTTFIVQLPEWA